MNINSSVLDKTIGNYPLNSSGVVSNTATNSVALTSSANGPLRIGAISAFDESLMEAQKTQLVDKDGWVLKEVIKKYPLKELSDTEVLLKELSDTEVLAIIALLEKPISKTVSIDSTSHVELSYTLLEYFQHQIREASKQLGIEIISINVIGGKLQELLKGYNVRTLNGIYESRCKELGIPPKKEGLISDEIAADLDRVAQDTDFVSAIKFDPLALLNRIGTHFVAEKLPEKYGSLGKREVLVIDYWERLKSKKDIGNSVLSTPNEFLAEEVNKGGSFRDADIKRAIESTALALVNNLGTRYFASKLPNNLGKLHKREAIIKKNKNFYDEFCSKDDFALASFGLVDSNFVLERNVHRSLFFHHSQSLDVISYIVKKNKHLLSKLIPKGGLQPLFERIWKRMRVTGPVNDRAFFAYLSNKGIGYGFWDQNMQCEFRDKVTFDPLPSLKKKWQNHHFTEPLALISLAFNSIMSLPEKWEPLSQIWWNEMMKWHKEEWDKRPKPISNEEKAPFFTVLKEALDDKSIPFTACKDMLQIHGYLLQASPQPKHPTSELKAYITNPEAIWHEVCIFQKIDNKTYSIAIPLNLSEAISSLIKLKAGQLDILGNVAVHLCPKAPYVKELISTELVTDKLADEALKCIDHPHKLLKTLGYDLLLLHALSEPKPWILKNLLKYFPVVLESTDKAHLPRLMTNLEEALKSFPDTIETTKLTSPIINFCCSMKTNTEPSLLKLCLAMVSTGDLELIQIASKHENLSLDERLQLIKALLPEHAVEATKLLLELQKGNLLTEEEEFTLFNKIAEVLKKNSKSHLQPHQLFSLSACAEQLLQRDDNRSRQTALMMAQSCLHQQQPEEVQKWLSRILQIASKNKDPETHFFVPQKSYVSLLSINLPPKYAEAIQSLLSLQAEELEIFAELIDQLPRNDTLDLNLATKNCEKSTLVKLSQACLKHDNRCVKEIGFELLLTCAANFLAPSQSKESSTVTAVDPRLLDALIIYLPIILSGANPTKRGILLQGMKDVLLRSASAKHAEQYLSALREVCSKMLDLTPTINKPPSKPANMPIQKLAISPAGSLLKAIYQANCCALASTKDPQLCQLSKKLVSAEFIKKSVHNFTDHEQIEITFATVKVLLLEQRHEVLEILQKLEKENIVYKSIANQSTLGTEKREICADIIKLLIDENDLQKAKEKLLKGFTDKIFSIDEAKTTEMWINLCQKTLYHSDFGVLTTVELLEYLKKKGGLPKKHTPAKQIDLMIDLIQHLYALKSPSSTDAFIDDLVTQLESLNLTQEQKSKLYLLVIKNLQTAQNVDVHNLKQSYLILKDTDLSWIKDTNTDYISLVIFWLKASQIASKSFKAEITRLIVNALKNINSSQLNESTTEHSKADSIIEISAFLVGALKSAEQNSKQANKELKNQIIVSHSLIAKTLQREAHFDIYFEYFNLLIEKHILDSISGNNVNQLLWLADGFLKKYSKDRGKLQSLHRILKDYILNQDMSSLTIDEDKKLILKQLATALIENQLHDIGKDWIDFILNMQKSTPLLDSDISQALYKWCESFADKQKSIDCFKLFASLGSLPNAPSDEILEKLCLKMSKFSLKDYSAEVLKAIESTFSFTKYFEKDSDDGLDRRFEIIEMLVESKDLYLINRGITYLSMQISHCKRFSVKGSKMWAELCNNSFQHWISIQTTDTLTFSQELHTLIHEQAKLIQQIPDSEGSEFAKKLELFKLRSHSIENFENMTFSLTNYCDLANKYLDDKDWLEASTKLIAENLIHWAFNSNNASVMIGWHVVFISVFKKYSQNLLNFYLVKFVQLGLNLKAEDNVSRAVVLFIVGKSINELIEFYMSDNRTELFFQNTQQFWISLKDLEAQNNIKAIICLVEKYLFCRPILKKEWLVKTSIDKSLDLIKGNHEGIDKVEHDLVLTRELFYNINSEMVQNLEKWGYDRLYPIQAMTFQIILENKPNINKYDDEILTVDEVDHHFNGLANKPTIIRSVVETQPLRDDRDQQSNRGLAIINNNQTKAESINEKDNKKQQSIFKKFENVSVGNHFTALQQVVQRLISHDDPYSSLQAINIMNDVSAKIWNLYSTDMVKLYSRIIDDNHLYPYYVKEIGLDIIIIGEFYRKNLKPAALSTELCICFYKKLQERSIFKFSIQNITSYIYALYFFPDCLRSGIFDMSYTIFIQFFEFHLDQLINSQVINLHPLMMPEFIYNSIQLNSVLSSDSREAIFALIAPRMNQIMCSDDKALDKNLQIFNALYSNGYFKNRVSHLADMWKLLFHQFPKQGSIYYTDQKVLFELIKVLFIIVNNSPEEDQMKHLKSYSICMTVSKNIENLVVKNEDLFTANVAIVELINSWGYYLNSKNKFNETLEMLIDQLEALRKKHGDDYLLQQSIYKSLIRLCHDSPDKTPEEKELLLKRIRK